MRQASTTGLPRGHPWKARLLAAILGLAALPIHADLGVSAPSGMPEGRTVTAVELWQVFDRALPAGVWVSPLENTKYEVVSAKWMRRTFLPAAKRQMREFWDLRIPEENASGNCNGFALVFRLMLGLSAMDSHNPAPATATMIVRQEIRREVGRPRRLERLVGEQLGPAGMNGEDVPLHAPSIRAIRYGYSFFSSFHDNHGLSG